jgi:hypothetical protein
MTRRNIVLYKYYPPERVDNLERRRIYFSHAAVFNDPFEIAPNFAPSLQTRIIEAIGPPQGGPPSSERVIEAMIGPLGQQDLFSGRTTRTVTRASPSASSPGTRNSGGAWTACRAFSAA